jgi:hypothetical protein
MCYSQRPASYLDKNQILLRPRLMLRLARIVLQQVAHLGEGMPGLSPAQLAWVNDPMVPLAMREKRREQMILNIVCANNTVNINGARWGMCDAPFRAVYGGLCLWKPCRFFMAMCDDPVGIWRPVVVIVCAA